MQEKADDSEQEPKRPSIQIGGSSPSYSFESDEDELGSTANQSLPHQTTVIGLNGGDGTEKQIEVIGPQYQPEKNEKPTAYQSDSQEKIQEEGRKKNTTLAILTLVAVSILAAAGYAAYRLIAQS